ncbi:MAG: hypothetical protein J0H98_01165 [Solirubrobacterales bacterium]|nr:hypothetical protein [Solirubrobacterales bacterium]
MREKSGLTGRVSNKLKALLVAALAILGASAVLASSAQAAEKLELKFNDSWILVDSLAVLTGGGLHALDPADTAAPKITVKGDLASDGAFSGKASDFSFPDQAIDASSAGMGTITLSISAASDYTGNYNKSTGVFTGTLPLSLTVDGPNALTGIKCQISPLNIALSTSGGPTDFGSEEEPVLKSATPFAGGNGALLGSWSGVSLSSVKGIAAYGSDEATMTDTCQTIIGALVGEGNSFDGSIWLAGSSTVTQVDDPECPAGQVGTPPNCETPKTVGKVSKVVVTKKAVVKAGKTVKIKVTVSNSGDLAYKGKIALKSTNRQVKAPKAVAITVAGHKSATKVIVLKAGKKAKGKAVVTASIGGKKAKSTVTVKAAKKKKRK